MKLNFKELGLTTGLTEALHYLGCMLVVLLASHEGSVKFFNSLLHGLMFQA